jgi:hypothetical protein
MPIRLCSRNLPEDFSSHDWAPYLSKSMPHEKHQGIAMSKELTLKLVDDLRKEIARLRKLKSISDQPESPPNNRRSLKRRRLRPQRSAPAATCSPSARNQASQHLDSSVEESRSPYRDPREDRAARGEGSNRSSFLKKNTKRRSLSSASRNSNPSFQSTDKAMIRCESYRPNGNESLSSKRYPTRDSQTLCEQNRSLKQSLVHERARIHSAEEEIEELNSELESLHNQLRILRREAHQSKLQIAELSSKLTKFKGPDPTQSTHSLSWEERKRILLAQLEAESEVAPRDRQHELLEIQDIVEETSELLRLKDNEIKNLIKLVEEQSIASDSLAVGAAAVGEAVNLDELVLAEQQKLKSLHDEWQERQRQFELEMSRERAKLARDRLDLLEELDEKINEHSNKVFNQTPTPPISTSKRGVSKWFAHLGFDDTQEPG